MAVTWEGKCIHSDSFCTSGFRLFMN